MSRIARPLRRRSRRSPRASAASTSSSTTPGIGAVGTVEDNDDAEWARVLDINVVGMARVSGRGAAVPAQVGVGGDRQHLFGRRAQRAAAARAVLGVEGCGALADPRDGGRPRAARASGSTACARAPRRPPGSTGCCRRPTTRRRNAPPSRPGSRWAGWSRPRRSRGAIGYLASPLSGSTTGTALDVDGGISHLRVRPVAAS